MRFLIQGLCVLLLVACTCDDKPKLVVEGDDYTRGLNAGFQAGLNNAWAAAQPVGSVGTSTATNTSDAFPTISLGMPVQIQHWHLTEMHTDPTTYTCVYQKDGAANNENVTVGKQATCPQTLAWPQP